MAHLVNGKVDTLLKKASNQRGTKVPRVALPESVGVLFLTGKRLPAGRRRGNEASDHAVSDNAKRVS